MESCAVVVYPFLSAVSLPCFVRLIPTTCIVAHTLQELFAVVVLFLERSNCQECEVPP